MTVFAGLRRYSVSIVLMAVLWLSLSGCAAIRGTGDLGVVIERTTGSVLIIETTHHSRLARIEGLGDLSHASVTFSRDGRYAYVFGRDGGLSKIDLLGGRLVKRIIQAGNSIGGAISQDGRLVAVSNYKPGGVRIFDAETLDPVANIPASVDGQMSRVVGLVDAPGQRFVFSLYDAGEIWIADMNNRKNPSIRKFKGIGELPYDGLITPDGRYYIAGLFGEDGMAKLDLWHPDAGVKRILGDYGKGDMKLPVYKMPHLEGWAIASGSALFPGVGRHEVIVADLSNWMRTALIPAYGQPVFVMARPDGRQAWVNFAFPNNDTVQIIDIPTRKIIKTLKPGRGILHMEFTPRGEEVWVSSRDDNKIVVYDTATLKQVAVLPANNPSGIFFTSRANRIGL